MTCDLAQQRENQKEAQRRVKKALDKLKELLAKGKATVVIGPTGGIAFAGWAEADRGGLSDACAYRVLQQEGSMELRQAVAMAELQSGRTANPLTIAGGTHSHDGGQTWHGGH